MKTNKPSIDESGIARFKLCDTKKSFSSCAAANEKYISQDVAKRSGFFSRCTRSRSSRLAAGSSVARLKPASGFTLLEVMVALAIFATAAIALTKVAMQYTQSTANAMLRTKAQFVAMNEAAQMEINKQWLTGTESKQVTSQGETWQIDKRSESTISPKVQRIEIQVSLFNTEQGKVGSGVGNVVFFNYINQVKTQ
ncbi:type II secretion system minor pseudopilin GspI [Acinetobacter ihumii]|uniref:type II secretion system minor pseudopilin GspI n=1 Tax=Acinetobacter ihumii TaxID=2483802 RepID=UPI0010321D80|nr:type II secretion system minor pseudopilin GspI [Acinetobacter ihumii]